MGKIMLNEISYSGGGGNADIVRLTQAEYDALPSSKLTDDKVYMITDTNGDGSQFQPVIYSENEREIGVWTDGKPLYEKTYTNVSLQNNSDATIETNVSNFEIKDFEIDFIGISGTVAKLRNCDDSLYVNNSGMLIYWINSTNWWSGMSVANITVRYTKSTDQAGSGTWTPQGVPAVHYSTDEQVVGTWIDGKTIYRKVVELSESLTIPSNTWTSTNINISGVNTILKCSAIDSNGTLFDFFAANSNQPIQLLQTRSSQIIATIIILEYTKTS